MQAEDQGCPYAHEEKGLEREVLYRPQVEIVVHWRLSCHAAEVEAVDTEEGHKGRNGQFTSTTSA